MMSDKRRRIRGTSRKVEEAARSLRKNMTRAEQVLWDALRYRKARGLRFRRQHPVGRFVLDFFCPSARLAVELDGPIHDQQAGRDEERTRVLEAAGYRILRFRNEEVLTELPSVLRRITAAAQGSRMISPPGKPSPRIGGGWRASSEPGGGAGPRPHEDDPQSDE